MGEIIQGPIGSTGSYDVKFSGGKLVASAQGVVASAVDLGASIGIDSDLVINALEAAIPGVLSKELLELARAGLKAIP